MAVFALLIVDLFNGHSSSSDPSFTEFLLTEFQSKMVFIKANPDLFYPYFVFSRTRIVGEH